MAKAIKMDTNTATFLASKPSEPVLDPNTGSPKLDKDGRPIYLSQVVMMDESGAEVLNVKVPGKPVGLVVGTGVKVMGLTATPWSIGERNGVSYSAEKIESITK